MVKPAGSIARKTRPRRPARSRRLFSDEAYERLKEMIITAALAPGALLTEADLAARLGLGRMPVREALQRLAQEDLVIIVPRKGSFVSPIRVEDLQKIFELRLSVEGLSARLAAERIREDELRFLEALIEKAGDVDEGSRRHVQIDRTFHLTIAAAARNEYLARAVERTLNLALRLLYLSGSRMSKVAEIAHEYRAVLDALRRGDGEAASAAMQAHIEEFRKKVRTSI
ncbi:MAG: GntR family transcriptional regulator [Armatimonadota bacterium]|nr:GntR family transcriptional regulator [Armatimonadota bacterium]